MNRVGKEEPSTRYKLIYDGVARLVTVPREQNVWFANHPLISVNRYLHIRQ